MMDLVIVIAVGCFAAGVWAASRWLPELAPGPVATLAFFAVCGLLGAALCVVGLHIDFLVRAIEENGRDHAELVAGELSSMLQDGGTLVGMALIVFLLAPRLRAVATPSRPERSPDERPATP